MFDECRCTDSSVLHGMDCAFIRSVRRLREMKPEEKRETYAKEIRERVAQLERRTATDVPYRLQKLGVPMDLIVALRAKERIETRALKYAKEFYAASRVDLRTLVLGGPRGIGKSLAAAWVLGRAVAAYDWNEQPSGGRQLPPFVWAHAAEVTGQTDFGRVDPKWLEGLRECRLLVLDDLGKDASAPGLSALRDVLTHRHEKRRATVITTNLLKPGLEEKYGESWFSRLRVATLAPVLESEKSMRRPRT